MMLVLSRRLNETIHIGSAVTIKVSKISGNRVSLGIIAPKGIQVLRGELVVDWSQPTEECAADQTRELAFA
jgi:carbon storage regulator